MPSMCSAPQARARGAALLFVLCAATATLAQGGLWVREADIPTPRYSLSASAVDGRIYAIGGYAMASQPTVEVYDPATDTWTPRADMPTRRYLLATAAVQGRIYAIGGAERGDGATSAIPISTVEMYDPATDTWARKADLPGPRFGMSVAVVDDRIYAIGGTAQTPYQNGEGRVEVYDPATDTWARRASMPTPRWDARASEVDGRIYVIGGLNSWTALTTVEMYDPVTDTWTRKADMLSPRIGFSNGVLDGHIYAFGGDPEYGLGPFTRAAEVYDPATDTWARSNDMPEAGHTMATAVVGHRIYLVSGEYGADLSPGPGVYAYDPGLPHLLRSATGELIGREGQTTPLAVEVELRDVPADGSALPLQLDLTRLGVPGPVSLAYQGDGRYTAAPTVALHDAGLYRIPVQIAPAGQTPSLLYALALVVLPAGPRVVFGQQAPDTWAFVPQQKAQVDPASMEMPYEGQPALAIRTTGVWGVRGALAQPVDRTGYGSLLLALCPQGASGTSLSVSVNDGPSRGLLSGGLAGGLSLDNQTWQEVVVPLDRLGVGGGDAFSSFSLKGNVKGAVYVGRAALLPAEVTATEGAIYTEGVAEGWRLTAWNPARVDAAASGGAHSGQMALEVRADGAWSVLLEPAAKLRRIGYRSLRLAVRAVDMAGGDLRVSVNDEMLRLVPGAAVGARIDPAVRDWQVVDIPLASLDLAPMDTIAAITLSGSGKSTLYVDDVYLEPSSLPAATAVLQAQGDALPAGLALEPSYPNPFNGETLVRYSLPHSGHVQLAVCDVLGQRVATLVNGPRPAGASTVAWSGTDDQGRPMASGVYLLRLQAGGHAQCRRVLLLR